jgi:hypothetical protein
LSREIKSNPARDVTDEIPAQMMINPARSTRGFAEISPRCQLRISAAALTVN